MTSSHPKVFHFCFGWVGLGQRQYKWICLASNSLCSPSWPHADRNFLPSAQVLKRRTLNIALLNFFFNLSFLPFFSFFVGVQCLSTCVEVRKQPSEVSCLLLPPRLWRRNHQAPAPSRWPSFPILSLITVHNSTETQNYTESSILQT